MSDWVTIVLSSGVAFVFGLLAERLRLSLGEHVKVRRYQGNMVFELSKIIFTLERLILAPKDELSRILNHDFTHYKMLVAQTELFYEEVNEWAYKLVFSKAYDVLKNPSYSLTERQIRAGRLLLVIKALSDNQCLAPFTITPIFWRGAIRRMEKRLDECRTVLRAACGEDVMVIDFWQEIYEQTPDCPLHPVS